MSVLNYFQHKKCLQISTFLKYKSNLKTKFTQFIDGVVAKEVSVNAKTINTF